MQVYRVENLKGQGPYEAVMPGLSFGEYEHRPGASRDVPGWVRLEYAERMKYCFGFPDFQAFKDWFEEDLENFSKYNFFLNEYKAKPKVFTSSQQVAFKKGECTPH